MTRLPRDERKPRSVGPRFGALYFRRFTESARIFIANDGLVRMIEFRACETAVKAADSAVGLAACDQHIAVLEECGLRQRASDVHIAGRGK